MEPVAVTIDERRAKDARHAAAIRAFRAAPDLRVQYLATAQNPYRDQADIDIYDDEHGFEYWLDPALGRLVQAGPRAGLPAAPLATGPDERLPVGTLRDHAVALVTAQVPDFPERRSQFHPFEDNRRNQIFFFRWEETGIHEFDLPPFLQVGLHADGTLACFTNTLEK
jgi:hypothetical protein